MGRQCVRVDVSGAAQRGQGVDGDLLGSADQPPQVETVPLGLLIQLCDQDPGALELIGFDAQPDIGETRVSIAVLALRKGELFGPACRLPRSSAR